MRERQRQRERERLSKTEITKAETNPRKATVGGVHAARRPEMAENDLRQSSHKTRHLFQSDILFWCLVSMSFSLHIAWL